MKNDEMLQSSLEDLERAVQRDRIFLNNPVIMQGLGLAPLVVVDTTMKNAVILSVAVILLLISTRVVGAVLARFTYFRFRAVTYAVSAAALFVGVYWILNQLFTAAELSMLGLYLPLLVFDPIILKRYENPRREKVSSALRKGTVTALGYALVLLLTAAGRELLGLGTLYGARVFSSPPLPLVQLPAGGFILLALLMALWRGVVNSFKKQINLSQGAK